MEKQSDYWHISGIDLKNMCESVYKMTSDPADFITAKQEYNKLLKFSFIPSVFNILKHAEYFHDKKDLIDNPAPFENNSTEEYHHISFRELEEMVQNNADTLD